MVPYIYKVKEIKRVVDGDTVDLVVDLGFQCLIETRFRLSDYDAPETWRPKTEEEKVAGQRVKEYLEKLMYDNFDNLFISSSKDPGIYGRYTGTLIYKDGTESYVINEQVQTYMDENNLNKEDVR